MNTIKVGQENSQPIELYYEDHGSGSPVVLIRGWPLNGDAWEKQTAALLPAGHRVITYDRRGFGRSSKPGIGYNYDTFAADLEALLSALNLIDGSLVGHSMGTGEITRYIGKYGTMRLRKAMLTIGPYLVKTVDNPEGVDRKGFEDTKAALKTDRPATLREFLKNFWRRGRKASQRAGHGCQLDSRHRCFAHRHRGLRRLLARGLPQRHSPQRRANHDHPRR